MAEYLKTPWGLKEVEPTLGFPQELKNLLNTYSMENTSDTPDYILAQYLVNCLDAFNNGVKMRDRGSIRGPLRVSGTKDE